MIVLTIDNSTSQISGLSRLQEIKLKVLLSYKESAYSTGGHKSHMRCLLSKRGSFPTGLLYLVDRFLYTIPYSRNDLRRRPEARHGLFTLSLEET